MISTWKNVMTQLIWGDKTLINRRRRILMRVKIVERNKKSKR